MRKVSLFSAALIACLALLSVPAFAQIYPFPTTTIITPTPTPTATTPAATTTTIEAAPTTATPTIAAPTSATPTTVFPTTTPATTPPAVTATAATTVTPLAAAVAASAAATNTIPGYVVSGGYGPGRTIAYAIAPFAVVAATYLLGGHHQIEIHPNAGFYWPGSVNFSDTNAHVRDEGMYGVKVGAYLNDKIEVEGNLAYVNHFESRFAPSLLDQSFGILPKSVWGLIYDVNGVYNFGKQSVLGSHVSPYVVGGIGGLSTEIRDGNAALLGGSFYATDPASGITVLAPTHTVTVRDNTAFFSINYGGGIRATNLWGPLGLRADIRGRTFPNFRGESLTWPEATAGLTFSFGAK